MPRKNKLRICLATSEMTPFAKTGGLADVASALSVYFHDEGHELLILMPFYATLDTSNLDIGIVPELQGMQMQVGGQIVEFDIVRATAPDFGPDFYLLRCPELFHGDRLYGGYDEHVRFALLSRASIEMCQRLDFAPDIFVL